MENYLAAIGDSLTLGLTASNPYTSEVSFPSNLSSRISNYGVSGQTLATILTNIASYAPLGRSNNIAVLWAGTNDLAVNLTPPATVFSNLQSATAALRANGFKVIVCTCISRSNLDDAVRATFNNLITSNPSSFDAVVNFGPTPLGINGGWSNLMWYNDSVHPTQAGIDTYEAPLIQAAINSFSYPLLPLPVSPRMMTPIDSRAAGVPVDSRTAPPVDSRTVVPVDSRILVINNRVSGFFGSSQ